MKRLIANSILVVLALIIFAAPVAAQQGVEEKDLNPRQKSALEQIDEINRELDEDQNGWLDKRRQSSERQYRDQIYEYGRQNAEQQRKSDIFINIRWGLLALCVVGFFVSLYRTIKRKREQKAQQAEK